MWGKKVPPALIRYSRGGMGIKFTKVDEKFFEIFA
jgi:hypothetical protein